MRVVSGIYKGRTLCEFKGVEVRPTSDMARESLFNILSPVVFGARFLDLCAGTGAVGIEALSRGAESVCFNDLSRDSVKIIKKNLEKIGNPKNARVTNLDALTFIKKAEQKFDIVFLDPPYKSDVYGAVMPFLADILSDGGIVVCESEKQITDSFSGLKAYDGRRYGRAHLTFYKKGE